MKALILNFFVALLSFGLNTCTKNPAAVADKVLVDTEWNLLSFEVIGVGESDRGSDGIFLFFKKDSTFKGRSSTNSYYGIYEAGRDDSLYIDIIASTKVGVPAGSRYGEYLQALRNSSAYEIEKKKLRIIYDDRTKALNFKAE